MPAHAQGDPQQTPPDIASLIERTCRTAPPGKSDADPYRLALFLLADHGVVALDPVRWIGASFAAERGPDNRAGAPTEDQQAVNGFVANLQRELTGTLPPGTDEVRLIIDDDRSIELEYWLLDRKLACVRAVRTAEATSNTEVTPYSNESRGRGVLENGEPILRLRGTPKELAATGPDRLSAGAARLSIERERVWRDDGTRRRDTTLAIQGALGLALEELEKRSAYLYAAYQLERVRSRPAPALPPGESAADGDTNVLEIGLTSRQMLAPRGLPVSAELVASGSLILDRVTRSERMRFDLALSPGFGDVSFGLCAYGRFGAFLPGIGARCTAALRWQVNRFLDRGRGDSGSDEFVLGGGEVTWEFAPFVDRVLLRSGVFAGMTYRYEASLRGDVRDIDRFTAYLKYRHWFGTRFGVDFGFDFADGINPESLVDENRLRVGFGVIF